MAQTFKVNVYEINGGPQKNIYNLGFPSAQCQFLPYTGNDTRCNAYIQTLPNQYQYSIAETVAQVTVLANA